VAAFGGSYGGYMTLASVAFYPERFRAAVDGSESRAW
jgi:dipeptidyl aminopeptidase/acylaminoacyl peptidase